MSSRIRPTQKEIALSLPGDNIVPNADIVMNRAFTLPAQPTKVWPWIMQLGKHRAGWYFPRYIEWFIPKRRRGLRHIEASLQNLQVGGVIDDWGGKDATFEVALLEPQQALVYASKRGRTNVSWAIILQPVGSTQTRVQLRLRLAPVRQKWLARTIGDAFDALTIAWLAAGLRERVSSS